MKSEATVLIIGDDVGVSQSVKTLKLRPIVVGRPDQALETLKSLAPSLVLLNLPNDGVKPSFLRRLAKEGCPIVILVDPVAESATGSIKNGKVRVLTRPVGEQDLLAALRTALEGAGSAPPVRDRDLPDYPPLLDISPAMRAIREIIGEVADTNATVLIRGESGVGKELVARAVHATSSRRGQSFVKVNCAALPGELLESELFGHEKGAFTGAYRRKLGKFEFANHGTLFLDEIGELPLALQAKLLHVLQDQEFSRVGGRETIRIDARVIASTNRDLEAALATEQFREDLYYRLNVIEIHIPPLRKRKEEIPALVGYFLEKFQRHYGREVILPAETLKCFTDYSWPGNVRELENVIRRLVVLGNVRQIQEEIVVRLQGNSAQQSTAPGAEPMPVPLPAREEFSMGLKEIARRAALEAERRAILEVLERVRWNRAAAARLLKISYKTLLSKIAKGGLPPKRGKWQA